jgi:two-component system CheB/CheR fusion protein
MQGGVAVTDMDLSIQVWNKVAEDMWGLRSEEVLRQPLFSLDIGLPLGSLRKIVREALDGSTSETAVDATNRRGRRFRCRVTCMPCAAVDGKRIGVTMLMVDADAAP